ncbi:MAG: hypothetical protein ACOY16_05930 [Chloroflexota bacterium]
MDKEKVIREFQKRIQRGRKFEAWERSFWSNGINSAAKFKEPTQWNGKRGRVDILLRMDDDGQVVIVEIKATDWDKIKKHRVKSYASQHARQIWRYIEAYLSPLCVTPAIVYPYPPQTPGRKEEVEKILNERGIECIWREEYQM